MPLRYPGIEGYRNAGRKFGQIGKLGTAAYANASIDADPIVDSNPPSDGTTAGNPNSVARFPAYKQPSTFQRIFAPEASRQIDSFNFQSQMSQAENAQQLSSNKELLQFQRNLDSVMAKARRDYNLSPVEELQYRQMLVNTLMSDTERKQTESGEMAIAADTNRPQIRKSYVDELQKQGYINRNTAASTRATDIQSDLNLADVPFRPQMNQLNIDERTENLRQSKEMFPYTKMHAGVINIPSGAVVGNVPTTLNGEPIPFYQNVPPSRPEEVSEPFINPSTQKPTGLYTTRKVAGEPGGIFNLGPLTLDQGQFMPTGPARPRNNPQQTTLTPDASGTIQADDKYFYRRDPATGKLYRAPKQ